MFYIKHYVLVFSANISNGILNSKCKYLFSQFHFL